MDFVHFTPLILEATRAAAQACKPQIGKGDKIEIDRLAVEAMRQVLNNAPISGTVVCGEGQYDESHAFHFKETVGRGGQQIELVIDPVEGTSVAAQGKPNALSVLAVAPKGGFTPLPDIKMYKIMAGSRIPQTLIHLDDSIESIVTKTAQHLGKKISDVRVAILDRPTRAHHLKIMDHLKYLGCEIRLNPDGDVREAVSVCDPKFGVDLYMGYGGAPEALLACCILKTLGGWFQGRLFLESAAHQRLCRDFDILDETHIFTQDDLVKKDCLLALTGVSDGVLLKGVNSGAPQSLVFNSREKSVHIL